MFRGALIGALLGLLAIPVFMLAVPLIAPLIGGITLTIGPIATAMTVLAGAVIGGSIGATQDAKGAGVEPNPVYSTQIRDQGAPSRSVGEVVAPAIGRNSPDTTYWQNRVSGQSKTSQLEP